MSLNVCVNGLNERQILINQSNKADSGLLLGTLEHYIVFKPYLFSFGFTFMVTVFLENISPKLQLCYLNAFMLPFIFTTFLGPAAK